MTDEAALLAAASAIDIACSGSDPAALAALFAPDADLTFWGSAAGEEAVGRREFLALATAITSAAGSFEITWATRRAHVCGDVGWVNARGVAEWRQDHGPVQHLPYRLTAVFVRRNGTWLAQTFHGSEPATG